MSVTGNGALSIRRKDLANQKSMAVAFKKLVFAHKASAGETGINLSSLTTPTEMSTIGFVQPSSVELQAARMFVNRNNLHIVSSSKGVLQDFMSYQVASATQINWNGWTADEGEVFICTLDLVPATSVTVADAAPLSYTGTLAAGLTEINVGQAFEINKYDSKQVGAVLVYVDGVLQLRNVGNATAAPGADGNYQEIDGGSGLGSVVKLNQSSASDREIVIVSNGLLVNNPSESRDQAIESLAGQVDAMVPTLAALAGVPEGDFQAAPNNIDLLAFGDRVNSLQRYRVITGDDNAVGPVDLIAPDTTGAAITVTLPTSPSSGDRIIVVDAAENFGTNGLTVARNGHLIDGAAADFTVSTDGAWIELIYVSAAIGWIVRG